MQQLDKGSWTIADVYEHLASIYGDANALTTPRNERFAFLMLAAGDLSRCYRKGKEELYGIALAQLFAWFMSLGDEMFRAPGGIILTHAMGEKYPKDHCGYCGHSPCSCQEGSRPDHTPSDISSEQLGWSLSTWQSKLYQLYGPVNREGGIPRAINRLFEEIAEVGLILHQADGYNDDLAEMRRKIAREMTDVLAWIFGIASLMGVDVETAVAHVYLDGCPVCERLPCQCRHFENRPRAGTLTHRFMSAEDILEHLKAA